GRARARRRTGRYRPDPHVPAWCADAPRWSCRGRPADPFEGRSSLYSAALGHPLEVRSIVTAPRAIGADRTPGASRSARGARTAFGSLAVLLLVGLLLRLTIAYVLLPGSGFESDIGTFTAWALNLGQ